MENVPSERQGGPRSVEGVRDALIVCGFALFFGGAWAQMGGPAASMLGGGLLMAVGLAAAWRA